MNMVPEKEELSESIQLEFGVEKWKANPGEGTARIIVLSKAAAIASDHGERLAVEGEICWAGMHS